MRKTVVLSLLLALVCLLGSCSDGVVYEKIHTIKGEKWQKDQPVVCEFEVEDSTVFYTIYMDIRNSVDYPYQNLFVFMDSQSPSGQVSRDTLEFILADVYGNWKGKGSRLKDKQYFFYPKVRFPNCGKYKFTFYQAMREDELLGIANFGMTVQKFNENKFRKEMEKRYREQQNK